MASEHTPQSSTSPRVLLRAMGTSMPPARKLKRASITIRYENSTSHRAAGTGNRNSFHAASLGTSDDTRREFEFPEHAFEAYKSGYVEVGY